MSTIKLSCSKCGEIFEGDVYAEVERERNQHESSCEGN